MKWGKKSCITIIIFLILNTGICAADKIINDNSTGGDCTTIGTWDPNTKTCTLSNDYNGIIQVESNGITLNGNHYTSNISINSQSDFTIKNFLDISTITISDSSGNNLITNNQLSFNLDPIMLHMARDILITDNFIFKNDGAGISLDICENISIIDNIIYDNTYCGISITGCPGNYIISNKIFCNGNGIIISDSWGQNISQNIISENINSGIMTYYSGNNNIINNIILNNIDGIFLSGFPGVITASNNHIVDNNILYNDCGIHVIDDYGNNIYRNNLLDNPGNNTYEILHMDSNQWDDGSIGNRYSDYDETCEGCFDIDNNGICDAIYNIPGGSGIDHYPIVHWKYKWIGDGSEGGSTVTTSELQDAIYHWLNDIPINGYMLTIYDLQYIVAIWLSG